MIETPRLRLIPFEIDHAAVLERGRSALGDLLGIDVPEGWPHFPEAYTAKNLLSQIVATDGQPWGTYLFLHRHEDSLVGSGGYKGRPNNGEIEIGYEVAPKFQNQGFATEAALGMIVQAFDRHDVTAVLAHTLPERNPSTRVLEKCGMVFDGSVNDPDDGTIWRWRVMKQTIEGGNRP